MLRSIKAWIRKEIQDGIAADRSALRTVTSEFRAINDTAHDKIAQLRLELYSEQEFVGGLAAKVRRLEERLSLYTPAV